MNMLKGDQKRYGQAFQPLKKYQKPEDQNQDPVQQMFEQMTGRKMQPQRPPTATGRTGDGQGAQGGDEARGPGLEFGLLDQAGLGRQDARAGAAPDASGGLPSPGPGDQGAPRKAGQGRQNRSPRIFEFQASDRQREFLAKELRKSSWDAAGTVKGNVVELQGDKLAKVLARLLALGYKPRKSGG